MSKPARPNRLVGALVALAGVSFVLGALVFLTGCDSPAAQRAKAEGEQALREAEAYRIKRQADLDAEADRAMIREAARDASHERTLEILPYTVLLAGLLLLGGLALFAFWDLRTQANHRQPDSALLVWIARAQAGQLERDRALWHAIGQLQRQALQRDRTGDSIVVVDHPSRAPRT